jgi:metallo-beta-lactamase family protein
MSKISFHGAAGTVTGSCHLLEFEHAKILLDAGEFQGPWPVEQLNYRPFAFQPSGIDALILSHGHLDHCGRIPLLAGNGFEGRIYCTHPTKDIAQLILMDAAHILKEEFVWRKKRLQRRGINAAEPLYSFEDVFYAASLFGRPVHYHKKIELGSDASLFFHSSDAGHILGSSQVYIDYRDKKGHKKRLLYTGDLGDGDRPVVNDPDMPERPVDVLVMESTYGNREHKTYEESLLEFEDAVISTIQNEGTVLIPTFALERAQEILFHIGRLKRSGRIAGRVPVFLNSPLAINITRLYRKHCGYCNRDISNGNGESPFMFQGLKMTESTEESIAIHSVEGPKIILAGSGMMTGGRIKHHLKHLLWKENTTLVIVGYQSEGTLGRKIVDGADSVKIFGAPVSVKARVYTINGFSAHADRRHLLDFARRARPGRIFVVHGEPSSSKALAEDLKRVLPAAKITVPKLGQKFDI